MKRKVLLISMLSALNCYCQSNHKLIFDVNSIWQFNDFRTSSKESIFSTSFDMEYQYKLENISFSCGPGIMNRYQNFRDDFTSKHSTDNGLTFNLNVLYEILDKDKIKLKLFSQNRFFWEFYSYRKTTFIGNPDVFTWRKGIFWKSPMLQLYLGSKIEYEPIKNFILYGQLGLLLDNYQQFSSNFSKKTELYGAFSLGISYHLDLKNSN